MIEEMINENNLNNVKMTNGKILRINMSKKELIQERTSRDTS